MTKYYVQVTTYRTDSQYWPIQIENEAAELVAALNNVKMFLNGYIPFGFKNRITAISEKPIAGMAICMRVSESQVWTEVNDTDMYKGYREFLLKGVTDALKPVEGE